MASSGKETVAVGKKRAAQGRRRIEIKKITDVSRRQVTFSKRRAGLFNKASELCVLTGAEIAIITQSMGGMRLYAFDHPSPEAVIDRYLVGESSSSAQPPPEVSEMILEHEREYASLCQVLEVEKKKTENLERKRMANVKGNEPWWDIDASHMGLEELEEYMASLEGLRMNVLTRADQLALSRTDNIDLNVNLNQNQDDNNIVGGTSNPDDFLKLNLKSGPE